MTDLFFGKGFLEHCLTNEQSVDENSTLLPSGVRLELWGTGILRVIPQKSSLSKYRVLLSCGVHGNETAPMELCDKLVGDITNGRVNVKNDVLFVIGNPTAANQNTRFIDENLNRLFCHKHRDKSLAVTIEGLRAAKIEKATERFFGSSKQVNLHYDLHTAIRGSQYEKFAVYPMMPNQHPSKQQLGFLETCELQAVLLSNLSSTTYSYYTSQFFGAHSFTVELGQVKPFGQNDLSRLENINKGIRRLISGQETFSNPVKDIKLFTVINEVIKHTDDFELLFPSDTKNFTAYCRGALLARDGDIRYQTTKHQEHIVFPNANVPIGHRALLLVTQATLP